MMKKIALTAVSALLAGSVSMAADTENSEKSTVDTSKNPITGTQTTTKKYKKKQKGKNGSGQDVEVTEKTKVKTDGTVQQNIDVEADTTSKH